MSVLEKVFSVFYGCGLNLGLFIRHHERIHQSEELQIILANCYRDLLRLVTGISVYYTRKQISKPCRSAHFHIKMLTCLQMQHSVLECSMSFSAGILNPFSHTAIASQIQSGPRNFKACPNLEVSINESIHRKLYS